MDIKEGDSDKFRILNGLLLQWCITDRLSNDHKRINMLQHWELTIQLFRTWIFISNTKGRYVWEEQAGTAVNVILNNKKDNTYLEDQGFMDSVLSKSTYW